MAIFCMVLFRELEKKIWFKRTLIWIYLNKVNFEFGITENIFNKKRNDDLKVLVNKSIRII